MSNWILPSLFSCATIGCIGEILVIIMPNRAIELLDHAQTESAPIPTSTMFLGVLSIFSVATTILLFLSGDPVFRIYGITLLALPLVVWLLKQKIKSIKYLIVGESTLCLIMLLDTIRTIAQKFGWI